MPKYYVCTCACASRVVSCDCHVTDLDEYTKSVHRFEVVLQKRKDDVKGVVDL